MNEAIANKWITQAWELPETPPRMPRPFMILTGEGLDVARACQRNWKPVISSTGQQVRPGLESAVGAGGMFTADTPGDILELIDALQKAQTEYRLLVDSSRAAPVDRAQFLLTEMRATLGWLFDDGQEDEKDSQLSNLSEDHDDATSQDALAAALYDYAELCDRYRSKIDGLGDFSAKLIEEARELGRALREHSAGPATRVPEPQMQSAHDLRNRLAGILHAKMLSARAAMRFVFRHHPEIAREAGSTYERRGRARRRQAASEVVTSGVSGTETTMEMQATSQGN